MDFIPYGLIYLIMKTYMIINKGNEIVYTVMLHMSTSRNCYSFNMRYILLPTLARIACKLRACA